jgi:hypothetical protein
MITPPMSNMKIGSLLDRVVFDSITVLGVSKCERNRASEGVILFEGFVSILEKAVGTSSRILTMVNGTQPRTRSNRLTAHG